jgi:hypothetical protein
MFVLSKQLIEPRKLSLLFDEACPSCGSELGMVLRCEAAKIPAETNLLTNPRRISVPYPTSPSKEFEFHVKRGSALLRDRHSHLKTGMEALDRVLVLTFGQLAVLHCEASHSLSLLLCVRAVLPQPLGPDGDVIFIDGGNNFDPYSLSERSIEHGLDPERMLGRIHLSRAFTHHQLSSLIVEKLPYAIEKYNAKLAVISDIMQLYCDPDIQQEDRQEALDIFTKTVRFLAALAEQKRVLIVATSLQSRNARMDNTLLRTAHVSAKLEERGALVHITVMRHPWIPQLKTTATTMLGNESLERYI